MAESSFLICNGCGMYSEGIKGSEMFNKITFNIKDIFLATSGFPLHHETIPLYFCNDCYSKFLASEARVRSMGPIEKLRQDYEKKCQELKRSQEDMDQYKRQIANLIIAGDKND